MEAPNPFLPEVTAFALTLHATRVELVAIAQDWADRRSLYVAVERFFPMYAAVSLPLAAKLADAVAEHEPIRRLCLRREPFFDGAINERQQTQWNPECLTIVLQPVSDDGLRATALTARSGDIGLLQDWADLVRAKALELHRGAYAIEPEHGGRQHVPDHFHTPGAHDLAAGGVPMLAASGSAMYEFYDLT
ncbi:MAG: hypothetical protein QOE31_3541 [Solirubrobacteraceae bacterium]|jgi:hypothetical protein|nr:hypothetical protein [Solirubrobacteraceae bacterium]